MFNDQQTKALQSELSSDRIKVRDKANIKLSYLEGFDIIDTANNIFGYGNWAYTISSLEQVSQEVNANQNVVICYKAIVKVDVYDIDHSTMISRQDVGFGTGVARSLADAHENSAKEAVTDALKRSLRSFGNQFGNSLYDKSKSVVQNSNGNIPNPALDTANSGQNQAPNQAMPSQIPNQAPSQAMPNQAPNDQVMGDIQSLRNMGLDVVEQNGFLLVRGNNIFAKKDTIKALGFRWDSKTKQWYKQLSNAA
nr:Rad52/Rad22 family DNA repair protein [uncultured Campylobacter sp.]